MHLSSLPRLNGVMLSIILAMFLTSSRVTALSGHRRITTSNINHLNRSDRQQNLSARFSSLTTHPCATVRLYNDNTGSSEEEDEPYNPRGDFGRSIRRFQSSALKETVQVGDTVVCKKAVPSLGIYDKTSYEVKSIYAQYFDDVSQSVVKQPLGSIYETIPQGSELYMTLFSPIHHSEPVVVSPNEVGLSSVRNELQSAAWLAVPGFFWVFVAANFYNTYHERTGGSFGDAFWGR